MTTGRTPLQPFLEPRSIAVFGASPQPGTLGHGLVRNLRDGGYRGRLHLISDRHAEIDGTPCLHSLDEAPQPVSLAVIATPAASIPEIIDACGRHGIRAAVIHAAGLREDDARSAGTAARLRAAAERHGIRLFGPKAFGYILPHAGLNVSPLAKPVPAGNLALVTQSAAVCSHILDWNQNDEFGFSAIFAPGESADIELPEILDHLAGDPKTEGILLYLEGLRDARGFLSALRAAAAVKPVIAVKAGNYPSSARIAEMHSGARVGRDDAFDAALRRCGALRVRAIGDMFSAARALTTPRKPRGNRLAIVANGGGPMVMAADQAAELGIALAEPTPATCERLRGIDPLSWSDGNPLDLGFDATPAKFVAAITACLADPLVDGVLAVLTPNSIADPQAVAEATIAAAAGADKPVLACWLGEVEARAPRGTFARARFPVFRTPENAVAAFAFMVNWVHGQALLLETPPALSSYSPPDTRAARGIVENALDAGRRSLTPAEAKAVLAAFHIPVSPTLAADTPTEAVNIANHLGYPVAMKTAAGDTRLHLRSAPEVALAFRELAARGGSPVLLEPYVHKPQGRQLSIAIRPDRVFGPMITLSEGGIAPEIYNARSIGLPPLNPRLVGAMLGVPYVARLLGPLKGKAAVAEAPLREILLRVSELASELPWVRALDIGALIADADGAIAVDAAIDIQPLPAACGQDRYGHMAICPYPAQLEGEWTLKDGSRCTIRPIRPEDALPLQDFVRGLSSRSKYFRFFNTVSELSRHQLARYTQIDYGRELTLVVCAERENGSVLLGEAHYAVLPDGETGDFAVVIADAMAGQGLGSRLMRCLIDAARAQGLRRLRGQVLADNEPMLGLMESLDFVVSLTDDESTVEVTRPL